MLGGSNRALQVRVANRLRASLARDAATGLPQVEGLSEADQRELCEVGGGRLAAVAFRFDDSAAFGEIVALISAEVRRADVLGSVEPGLLLLLLPGLEPIGGQSLVERLRLTIGESVHGGVTIGIAYRSGASSAGWTARALAAEAAANAIAAAPLHGQAIAS